MLLKIALRNIIRQRTRSAVITVMIAGSVALIVLGNAIFESAQQGIRNSFVSTYTGDLSVSAISDQPTSIFGVEVPVIGEFSTVPTIPDYSAVERYLEKRPEIDSTVSQVTGLVLFEFANFRELVPAFGLNPERYFSMFPSTKVVAGSALKTGQEGLMLSDSRVAALEAATGQKIGVGTPIRLSVFNDSGFRIVELKLAGIVHYKAGSDVLDRVAIVDTDSLRSLTGMTLGNSGSNGSQDSLAPDAASASDIDSLFDSVSDVEATTQNGLDLSSVEAALADTGTRDHAVKTDSSAWNFVLIRVKDGTDPQQLLGQLNDDFKKLGWEIKTMDWRGTAGNAASIIYIVQIMYNVGMFLLGAVAIFIIMNFFITSVLERVPEIGSMRAMGAGRAFVQKMFLTESALLSGIAGLIGIAVGSCIVAFLAEAGVKLQNPLLITVFGGNLLTPAVSAGTLLGSLVVSLLVGMMSVWYPVALASRISPNNAMQSV